MFVFALVLMKISHDPSYILQCDIFQSTRSSVLCLLNAEIEHLEPA